MVYGYRYLRTSHTHDVRTLDPFLVVYIPSVKV